MRPLLCPVKLVSLSLGCVAAFLSAPTCAQAEATASYQATNWDKEITLPPNAYRAGKPIELNGDFTVKTQPGTLIEAVSCQTRGGVQHWEMDGTVFRRCRIGVKRNGSGHATDCVFEDCNFNKDDNWYSFWWSTHWRFENCIFTKQFVRGDLPPLDYSVHATRCTFYGVKLPPVGYKENPANYMGKGDMVFEKCRFVDCDVPQTFLASTVDCVFEDCRFEAKGKPVWPKETTAIKVHAYYDGTGNEPASFLNGPLTVEFEQAPRGGEFGSTLPHSQGGGRVTLTNLHLTRQFAQLGTTPKKASEIVDVVNETSGPATPASTPNPVLAATPPRAPMVAAGEVRSVEELLRALPANIEVMTYGQPDAAGIEAANSFLARNYVGRAVSLRMTLASTQALGGQGDYQANGRWQGVLYHGATIPACAVGTFPAANATVLAKMSPSSQFLLGGIVSKAEFVARGSALSFTLYVAQAQMLDAVSAHAAPATVNDAASSEAQMVGVWTVLFRSNGFHAEQTFGADHSCSDAGHRFATWEIADKKLLIHSDSGSGLDAYDLPVRDGVLYGRNKENLPLVLARQDTPTPPAILAQVVARWDFDFLPDDRHEVWDFNADHTVMKGDKLVSHWRVLGHSLLLEYEGHSDWHDVFDLPGAEGVLIGVNGAHSALMLTRLGPVAVPSKPATARQTPGPTPNFFGDKAPVRVP